MAGRKFEPRNINGLKFFKGTLYGPGEDLPEAKRRFRLMNKEEMDRYDRKVDESKGFDVDGCTGAMPGRIVPISPKYGEWQVAESLARWAVDKQLRRRGNPLESISVVKVNLQPVRGEMFYITLTAFDTADGETKTYRAKVWHGIWEYKLMYFEEFPEKTGTSYKARASKSRSKAKKGKAVQSSGGVLLGFNALLRKIKSQNPSMTHTMARKAASKNWKFLSNAEKKTYISEANLKKQI